MNMEFFYGDLIGAAFIGGVIGSLFAHVFISFISKILPRV